MLVSRTERLKFLVAFRPGFLSPTLAAQQAATYQRHSGGRLLLNVVTGCRIRCRRSTSAGTALVGSHEEVADRIAEYHALGIEEFVLSGYPHLEEAWWFGEGVMPILRRRGLWAPAAESVAGSARTAAFARLEGSR